MLEAALGPDRLTLRLTQSDHGPLSWGIGFYEGGEPLVRKAPLDQRSEVDLLGVVAETRSDLLIGHVRQPTVGSIRAENTHPFRFRNWLFAHSGTIHKFKEIKGKMLDAMPSFLRRSFVGDTDSECIFYLMLSFLHDSRQLDSPRITATTVSEALTKALFMVDELEAKEGAEELSPSNILMSNGSFLIALRRHPNALQYMTYVAPGREEFRPRAVLVACEVSAVGSSWTTLPDNSLLMVKRDLSIEVAEF